MAAILADSSLKGQAVAIPVDSSLKVLVAESQHEVFLQAD
jgi:hypothetical protein